MLGFRVYFYFYLHSIPSLPSKFSIINVHQKYMNFQLYKFAPHAFIPLKESAFFMQIFAIEKMEDWEIDYSFLCNVEFLKLAFLCV